MLGYFAIYADDNSRKTLRQPQTSRRRGLLGWLPHEIARLNRR